MPRIHWGWRTKASQDLDNDSELRHYYQPIKYHTGKTHFVPLESYHYRDKLQIYNIFFDIIVYSLAFYGLFKLVLEPVYHYGVSPYLHHVF